MDRYACERCGAVVTRFPHDVVLVDAAGAWTTVAIPPIHWHQQVIVAHENGQQRLDFTRSGELDIQGRVVFRSEGSWAVPPAAWSPPPPPLIAIESALTEHVLDGLDTQADHARGLVLGIAERVAGEIGHRRVETPELVRALVTEIRRLRALVRALKGYPEPLGQDEAAREPVNFEDLLRHA